MKQPLNTTPPNTDHEHTTAAPKPRRNPLTLALDRLSSVRLGIASLAVLFVYAAVGSAGHYPVIRDGSLAWSRQMVRQLRPFEMTEFEWFHTWFFVGLCALICLNLTVVTIRKIPLTLPKLGVWMIHTGIVILAVGSVIYFGTKVEGDTPVIRRQVTINLPDNASARLPALTGAERTLNTPNGPWTFRIADINPQYTLLSTDHQGEQDFAVTVEVTRPDGRTFFRQLLDNHPAHTEDAVMRQDAAPGERPMQRVRNLESSNGDPLFDDTVAMSLSPLEQQFFWVKDSWAIALRDAEDPADTWTHRPLRGMPRYNDYIQSPGEVFPPPGVTRYPLDPLDITASPADDDPYPNLTARVTGYLRYAVPQELWRQGQPDDPINPVVKVLARVDTGEQRRAHLIARDPTHDTAFQGLVGVEWVNHPDDLTAVQQSLDGPVIDIRIPSRSERLTTVIDQDSIADSQDAHFTPIRSTGFAYRVRQIIDRLQIPGTERSVSVAEVEFTTPDNHTIRRWVFADPRLTRDLPPASDNPADAQPTLDPRIDARFVPAAEDVLIATGPAIGVRILSKDAANATVSKQVTPRQFVPIAEGVELAVTDVLPRAVRERKPAVVPTERRQADADKAHSFAMAKVELFHNDDPATPIAERWLPFHAYSFDDEQLYAAGLGTYRPDIVTLPDGRSIKLLFTRQRQRLPDPVALHDFHLRAHIGGFTGESLSIRDWVSEVRFQRPQPPDPNIINATSTARSNQPEHADRWGDIHQVRVNHPHEHQGFWFFQSFWDAPRTDSSTGATNPGMTFTGLGVGNRNGVYTALAGSTLAVVGMIYAFYVKPVILRRRRNRVYNQLAAEHNTTTHNNPDTTTEPTA